MKKSENLYYEVVKYNRQTHEILAREIIRQYAKAERFCVLRDQKLTLEEKQQGISCYIRKTTKGL